ncbi:MAG: ATP-binding protein [Vicinamibacterales bacterium]
MTTSLVRDLTNLLTTMEGCVEKLRQRRPPDLTKDPDLAELARTIDHAFVVAAELLALSEWRSPRQTTDVNHVVSEVAPTLTRVLGPAIDLKLRLTVTADTVLMSPADLEQILLNLVMNARDAMPNGGTLTIRTVTLEHMAGWIGNDLVQRGHYLRLTVSDTGCGIRSHMQRRVSDPSLTPLEHGTGLSLDSIAHSVRKVNGLLHVESEEDVGTSVHIDLPSRDGKR